MMDTKKRVNRRSLAIGVIVSLLFFLLVARTFYIQSVEAVMLKEKARNIWNSSTVIEPKRGTIFDRNEERLAYNSPAYTVVAVLSKTYSNHIIDPEDTATKLSPLLHMDKDAIVPLLTKDAYQVELRPGGWKIDKSVADKIKELNIPGIILKDGTKRYYPNNVLGSYVLGFVNYDNQPVMGVERQYDDVLSGKPGELNVMKDLKGYELPDSEEFYQPAKDGESLVLTIDKTIQQYVESALDKTYAMYHPKRMVAVVANPKTGEILAMSSRPTYNPNEYWNIKDYRNAAIGYEFEPGSTFKIVTLAATIEEGIFKPYDTFMSGKIEVPGGEVRDYNNGEGWGRISFLRGVEKSSNVAFVLLGYKYLGKEKLFSYINKFGFGEKTEIDLPGEVNGFMKKASQAYPLDVANIAFGQGIAVTPIQQVMAVSAVANGGDLMKPYIVKKIIDTKTGKTILENKPTVIRKVISEETAKKTTNVLEQVVEYGKQRDGYIDGYTIAGKTGTSQKIGEDGKYVNDKSIASFIGYAPAKDPKLLVYVVVDEPDLKIPYYGSTIAVPIFRDIMQNSLRYLKVPVLSTSTTIQSNSQLMVLPNYKDKAIVQSSTELNENGLVPIVVGSGNKVLKQYPNPGTNVIKGANVYLFTEDHSKLKVPNLLGKSLSDALEYCSVVGIDVEFNGSGFVIRQSIQPNTLYKGQKLTITLADPKETTK